MIAATFDPDDVQDVLTSGRTLDPAAVGSQLVIMSAASIVTVLAFNILRPKNRIIYEPKIKYHAGNKAPPRISSSIFGWLPPLIHTKEPELLDKIGLDAATFLRFLRLMRTLFNGVVILTCGALIPVDYLYNIKHKPKKRDFLSMMTIRDVKGNFLYVHVAVSYLITILVVVLVYFFWRDMVRLRKAWFRSPEYIDAIYARTLSITGVSKAHQSDEGVKRILDSVKMPYPATSIHVGRRVGQLPELIEYHNQVVRDLEAVLVKHFKHGRTGRPTIKVGGCCGLGGTRQDALQFYTVKLKRTEAAVEDLRSQIHTQKPESYGFASLAAVPYAHIAARRLGGKHPKGTTITLAPNPKDILWENMNKSPGALTRKKMVGWALLAIICVLSLIPLLLVAVLANMDAVAATGYLPFLNAWSDSSPLSFAIVSGVLPPAVSGLFTFFLPRIMRWMTQYMGALTHARLDRAVVARYFAFLVISQLIIFTLIGVVFNYVSQMVVLIGRHASKQKIFNNLHKIPNDILKTYVNQSSYWLKFFPFRGFLVVFDLAQVVNLVWIYLKTRIFGRTPRDIREWTQPPVFEYAIYYANLLFLAAIGLLFAPLAPLVALAAAVVFWMSSWVYKYQLMYVFVTRVETGGRLWNVAINRLLVCVLLMQSLMVLTIGLQYKFRSLQWISTLPPFLIIIFFRMYISDKFDKEFRWYRPSEEELRNAKVHSSRGDVTGSRLEHRFGHPSLHAELFTPMIHAKMMPLLSEVEKGRMSDAKAQVRLGEYGGENVDARIVEGIKIAAVDQNNLEYDPALYQRDRGDSDRHSIASTALLGSPSMPSPSLNREYASTGSAFSASPRLSDYASMPSGPSSPQPLITPVERLGYYANNHGRQSSYFEQGSQYGTSSYSAIPTGIVPAHPSDSSIME